MLFFNKLDSGKISVMFPAQKIKVEAAVKALMVLPGWKTPTEMIKMPSSKSLDTTVVASTTSGVILQA